MKRVIAVAAVCAFAIGALFVPTATADDGNGQAIGQDPVRLALTICSDAGRGNGGEYVVIVKSRHKVKVFSECLDRHLTRKGYKILDSIWAQASDVCWIKIRTPKGKILVIKIEIDPGNSAGHNNGGG
ncbi:MAG: hypothetical protein R2725_13505 [Solirubrobacterales bacterium]